MCEDPGNAGKSGQERVPELPDHQQEEGDEGGEGWVMGAWKEPGLYPLAVGSHHRASSMWRPSRTCSSKALLGCSELP